MEFRGLEKETFDGFAEGEVNIRFYRLINQIAAYSKVNDCFILWKCFIVIY